NIFNHTNWQGFNSNDTTNILGPSATNIGSTDPLKKPTANPDFFTCTSCMRPNGTYAGSNGQILHLADLQKGKISKDLLNPVFGLLGDPGAADIPRTLQLSFHVRF